MLPTIGSIRPNAPNTWSFSRAVTFNMARHHILPYNTLRDSWNRLVETFTTTQLPEARTATRQFLVLSNARIPKLDERLEDLNRGRLEVFHGNAMMEAAVWAPWNIVDGPKTRSDDPGDNYLDRFTFGVTLEEFARMGVIERLYHVLEEFNTFREPSAHDLGVLTDEIATARFSLSGVEKPIPFRTEMWEQEAESGLWHKRRSGEQFLVTTTGG